MTTKAKNLIDEAVNGKDPRKLVENLLDEAKIKYDGTYLILGSDRTVNIEKWRGITINFYQPNGEDEASVAKKRDGSFEVKVRGKGTQSLKDPQALADWLNKNKFEYSGVSTR